MATITNYSKKILSTCTYKLTNLGIPTSRSKLDLTIILKINESKSPYFLKLVRIFLKIDNAN